MDNEMLKLFTATKSLSQYYWAGYYVILQIKIPVCVVALWLHSNFIAFHSQLPSRAIFH